MEGRYPSGLLFVLTNCSDPAKEEEFNYWYNHIHLPDVTSFGIFRHAIRFVSPNPQPGQAKYLATYETEWEDVAAAWMTNREKTVPLRQQGRSSPLLEVVLSGAFKKLGGEFTATANRPVRGIMVVLTKCKDPAREEEFNRWYSDIHIPDILDSGLYHTAYRYQSVDPEAAGGKYLTVYETDHPDPVKARQEVLKLAPSWEQRGRRSALTEVVFSTGALRLWPTS